MRRSLAALLAVFALVFVAGCGASGGDDAADTTTTTKATSDTTSGDDGAKDTTTTTEAASSDVLPVDEWAAGFCGNFSTWLDGIKAASGDVTANVTPGDLESAKAAVADLFGTASSETQDLIAAMEEGGSPDIEDGDQLVEDLIGKFQEFDDAALKAQSQVQDLDASSPTFQADTDALTSQFQDEISKVGDSFSEIDAKYPSSDLNAALTKACSF